MGLEENRTGELGIKSASWVFNAYIRILQIYLMVASISQI
jgi:hypothetical protein